MWTNSSRPYASEMYIQKSKLWHFYIFIHWHSSCTITLKKHCNSRTEISPITFQNTLQKLAKNIRIHTFLKWIRRHWTEWEFSFVTTATFIVFKVLIKHKKKQHCGYSPPRQVEMVYMFILFPIRQHSQQETIHLLSNI